MHYSAEIDYKYPIFTKTFSEGHCFCHMGDAL